MEQPNGKLDELAEEIHEELQRKSRPLLSMPPYSGRFYTEEEDVLNEAKRLAAERRKEAIKEADARKAAVKEEVRGAWNNARKTLAGKGRSGLELELQSHERTLSEAEKNVEVARDHVRYFWCLRTECSKMGREYGAETETTATATALWRRRDSAEWSELEKRGWSLTGTDSPEGVVRASLELQLSGRIKRKQGIDHLPPADKAYFSFGRETWEEAARLVLVREDEARKWYEEAVRLREVSMIGSIVIGEVRRQDLLSGKFDARPTAVEKRRGTGRDRTTEDGQEDRGQKERRGNPSFQPLSDDRRAKIFNRADQLLEQAPDTYEPRHPRAIVSENLKNALADEFGVGASTVGRYLRERHVKGGD